MFHLFVVVVAHFTGYLLPDLSSPSFFCQWHRSGVLDYLHPFSPPFFCFLTPDCVKSPRSKLRERRSDQDVVLFKPQLWRIIFFKLPDTQQLAISLLYSGLGKTKIGLKKSVAISLLYSGLAKTKICLKKSVAISLLYSGLVKTKIC